MEEIKCVETKVNSAGVVNTGLWYLLNPLVQGYTAHTRGGDTAHFTHLSMQMRLVWQATKTGAFDCRILYFIDHQPNRLQPDLATMFADTTATYVTIGEPLNWVYKDRFEPLFDKTYGVSQAYGGTSLGLDASTFIKEDLDLDLYSRYITNVGDISDIETGALWCFAYCPTVTGITTPFLSFWARTEYYDC